MPNHLQPIYHLVPVQYYQAQPRDQAYFPKTFTEDGFIHCTSGLELVVEVANRYFDVLADGLLVLEVDPARLTAILKFEPPQPPANSTARPPGEYADRDTLFPHIYGPLNREAIVAIFELERSANGRWQVEESGVRE